MNQPRTENPYSLPPRVLVLALCLIGLLYAAFEGAGMDAAYVDVGDGNYMYISSRLADGLLLYRDITSPQPPLHLYVGSLVVRVSRALGMEPLYGFRVFQILLRLTVMGLVAAITHRLFRCSFATLAAAVLYLILPVGHWWTQGYQSEPLELVPMCLAFFLLLDPPGRRASVAAIVGAGVASALALLTNMTFAPYACFFLLYLALAPRVEPGEHLRRLLLLIPRRPFLHRSMIALARRRDLFLFGVPFLLLFGGTYLSFHLVAGPAFLQNVWFNQVGSFAENPFMRIVRDFGETMPVEGTYILLAVVGIWIYAVRSRHEQRLFVVWYALSSIGSIVFTAKGGTRNYVFSLGEPLVAAFGAYALALLGRFAQNLAPRPAARGLDLFTRGLVVFTLVLVLTLKGNLFLLSTWLGEQNELPEAQAARILQEIRLNSERGDEIISSPFFAFMTNRRLAEEVSEEYLSAITYFNTLRGPLWPEGTPFPPSFSQMEAMLLPVLEDPAVQEEHAIVGALMEIRQGIREQRYPIVILNQNERNLFGNLYVLRSALAEHYEPVPLGIVLPDGTVLDFLPGRNAEFHVYVPR